MAQFGMIDAAIPLDASSGQTPLKSNTDLPLKVQPFKPIDVAGDIAKGEALVVDQAENTQKLQTITRENQDRDAMQQMLAAGANPYTPAGVEAMLTDAKDKVSPDTYMKLVQHAQEVKKSDAALQEQVARTDVAQNTARKGFLEASQPLVEGILSAYDSITKAPNGGTAAADAELPKLKAQVIQQLSTQPGYKDPALLQALGMADNIQAIKGIIAGTDHTKQAIENGLKLAETAQHEQTAKLLESGGTGVWKTYQDDKGGNYRNSPNGAVTMMLTPTGWQPAPAGLPPGAKLAGSKGAGEPQKGSNLKPETLDFMAEYERDNGKPFPVPAVGAGNTAARERFLNSAAELYTAGGYDGSEAGQRALRRDAGKEALKRLTTQATTIDAGARDAKLVMASIVNDVKELGGPDSPLIRKILNKGATELTGDPQYTKLNADLTAFREASARVFSGQSGAGGTPVAYLKLGEELMSNGVNLRQALDVQDKFDQLVDFRKQSVDSEKEDLLKGIRFTPKAGSELDKKRADAHVSKDDQKSRDAEAVPERVREFNDTRALLADAKSSQDRADILKSIKAAARDAKAVGAKLPEVDDWEKAKPGDVFHGRVFKGGSINLPANWETL